MHFLISKIVPIRISKMKIIIIIINSRKISIKSSSFNFKCEFHFSLELNSKVYSYSIKTKTTRIISPQHKQPSNLLNSRLSIFVLRMKQKKILSFIIEEKM